MLAPFIFSNMPLSCATLLNLLQMVTNAKPSGNPVCIDNKEGKVFFQAIVGIGKNSGSHYILLPRMLSDIGKTELLWLCLFGHLQNFMQMFSILSFPKFNPLFELKKAAFKVS